MTKLKVKTEKLPRRCEICHQSDLFDPESEICHRCKDIEVSANTIVQDDRELTFMQRILLAFSVFTRIYLIRLQINLSNQANISLIKYCLILSIAILGIMFLLTNQPSIHNRPSAKTVEIRADGQADNRVKNNTSSDRKNNNEQPITYSPDSHGIFKDSSAKEPTH